MYFLSFTLLLIPLSLLLYLGLKKRVGGGKREISKSRRMNGKDEMDAVVVWVVMGRHLAGQGGHMMGV